MAEPVNKMPGSGGAALRGILFLLAVVCCTGEAHASRHALLAGLNTYAPATGWKTLPSCVNDANGVRGRLLLDPVRWKAADITTLTDGGATEGAIRAQLTALAARAVAGDLVVYYQSSHGGISGSTAFLCAYDSLYCDYELAGDLDLFAPGVTVVVVIDACNAGGMIIAAEGESAWPFAQNVMTRLERMRTAEGRTAAEGATVAWIAACSSDQTCWAGTTYSLFTKYVIEGLVLGDANGDQALTFMEVFNYAGPRASAENPAQTAETLNAAVLGATTAVAFGDDEYEENDGLARAHDFGFDWRGRWLSSIDGLGIQKDIDWYRLSVDAGNLGRMVVACTFTQALGDIDLALYDRWTNRLAVAQGASDRETLMAHITQAGDYFVAVYGGNAGNAYDLSWTVESNRFVELDDAIDTRAYACWCVGAPSWVGQTSISHDGVDAAESGRIGDLQTSRMDMLIEGPGTLAFAWKVSSDPNRDVLRFYVDGQLKSGISGERNWVTAAFGLPSGAHTVSWRYEKDAGLSVGYDGGWVDQIVYYANDTDGDGLPDWWELKHFDSATAAGADDDPDEDGVSNRDEFNAATHPRDDSSRLCLQAPRRDADGSTVVTWSSAAECYYQLECCTNVAAGVYEVVVRDLPGRSGTMSFSDAADRAGPVLYRVKARK